ncbi:hypothetical protein LCGC14_1585810, partial [marine sediment metagenome]
VCNESESDLTLGFVASIMPVEQGIEVVIPGANDIEGNDCESFSIDVVASGDAVPQMYVIALAVTRE